MGYSKIGRHYEGFWLGLLNNIICTFIYSYLYSDIRWLLSAKSDVDNLVGGAIAGVLTVSLTTPLWVVYNGVIVHGHSAKAVCESILRQEGWKGLWRGYYLNLLLVSSPAIQYAIYERLRVLESMWQSFVVASVARTIATIVTYPLTVLRTRQQVGNHDYMAELTRTPTLLASGKIVVLFNAGRITFKIAVWPFICWHIVYRARSGSL